MLSLSVDDVDWPEQFVSIRSTKNRQPRRVPIGHSARQALWRYVQRRGKRALSDALFINRSGAPVNRNTVQKRVQDLGRKAGLGGCGCHRLRHTFATIYLRNGGDVMTLSRILGHSGLEMTRRYITLTTGDLRESHRKASPLDRLAR